MRRRLNALCRNTRGASAIEFALVVPFLVLLLVGMAQMGRLYLAHAGLRNLVADSARFASVAPRPTDAQIKARLRSGGFGLDQAQLTEPNVTYGAEGNANWAMIEQRYSFQLDFIFWRPAPMQLVEQRRVFIYPAA